MDLKMMGKESFEPGPERRMSYRACFQCCPTSERVDAKVLVHKHITENQELSSLVTMLAQNFRINKRLTFLLIEDNDGDNLDYAVSGMEIKRESALNDFLACEMKTIKTEEDIGDGILDQGDPDTTDLIEDDEDGEPSPINFEEDHQDEQGEDMLLEDSKERKSVGMACVCHECGKVLGTQGSLVRHVKMVHQKDPKYNWNKKIKDHTCKFCGIVIHNTYQKYFYHQQQCEAKVTGVNKYVCSICGRSFGTTYQHSNHYTSCSGKQKKYYNQKKCTFENCDYKTSTNIDLENHMNTQHLNKPISKNHICNTCGKTYNKTAQLNQHIRSTHLNEKPHECPTCGKCFARKEKLKDHILIHTGILKYRCVYCEKGFNNTGSLWNHKKHCSSKQVQIPNSVIVSTTQYAKSEYTKTE